MEKFSISTLRTMYLEGETTPKKVINEIIKNAKADEEDNIWIIKPDLEWINPYLEVLGKRSIFECPLWGIPFAIKDNIDLKELPTTAACPQFSYIPKEDAVVVRRLIEAGAIPIGKTNMDQFATGLVGTRSPYGEVRNALKGELISGGSSSGSAVAVAKGLAVFSLGTDTAGSGRVPAALNRLIGLKPAVGAWPGEGMVKACASLDCITVFANTLEDAYLVDEVVRGKELDDEWSRNSIYPNAVLPKKVLIPQTELQFYGDYGEKYKEAWNHALDRIKRLGIPIEKFDYTFVSEAAKLLYEGPCVAERWAELGEFVSKNEKDVFPVTAQILKSSLKKDYDAADVYKTLHTLQKYKKKLWNLLKGSVLLLPTCGGTFTREQVDANPIETNSQMGLYTNHCNLLDLAAIAVPGDDIVEDVPFGVTFFATSEEEGLVKGIAEKFLKEETTLVAVCGLHMRGFPLEMQMKSMGAIFVREAKTAEKYRMFCLKTIPEKPGLVKDKEGNKISVEIWKMPIKQFGKFVTMIQEPLGIGKVELEDGTKVNGFIYDRNPNVPCKEITQYGGWRKFKDCYKNYE